MSLEKIIEERGGNYGHPYDHFNTTQGMFQVWLKTFDGKNGSGSPELDNCIRHGVYMMLDKLARMAHNPLHGDNLTDIKGYATTIEMCIEEDREINGKEEQ